MAGRPRKTGLEYFPLDVGFLNDPKIRRIKVKHGAKGVVILLALLCRIYGDRGYYMRSLGDDDRMDMVDELSSAGVTQGLIEEVVQSCLLGGVFDQAAEQVWHVYTSPGIQRRYLVAASKRDHIEIVKEYFLLDPRREEDVPKSVLQKISFKCIQGTENPISSPEIAISSPEMPISSPEITQSKSKRIKKEGKKEGAAQETPFGNVFVDESWQRCVDAYHRNIGALPIGNKCDELQALFDRLGEDLVRYAIDLTNDRQPKVPVNYLLRILQRWEDLHVSTLAQAQALVNERKRDMETNGGKKDAGTDGRAGKAMHADGGHAGSYFNLPEKPL